MDVILCDFAMSGLKIVLKLNRAKVGPSGVSSGSAPPPPGTAPIVGQPVPEDSGAHSKKEKKAKKEKKKHKRHRHEHGAAPASGDEAAGGDAAPEGERPTKKQKRQDQTADTGMNHHAVYSYVRYKALLYFSGTRAFGASQNKGL